MLSSQKTKKNKPLLYDQEIIGRVKQYLEENVDKTYLDVSVMTKQLQERFPEYSRRKNAPFRQLVEHAYRIVSQSYGLESQPSSGDDSDGSDLEVMDDSASNNLMRDMMNNLYSKRKANAARPNPTKQSSAAEAIDISSDDDSGDERHTNGKASERGTGAALPGIKSFRDVTLTKLGNTESSSKGSSSTSATTDSAAAATTVTQPTANKRQELADNNDHEHQQPTKKQKTDTRVAALQQRINQQPMFQQVVMQQQQHQQQQQRLLRFAAFNQNSNESGAHNATTGQVRQRKYKKEVQLRKSRQTFQDIGGMEKTLKELCELLMHIKSPDIYFVLGLMPPRGILLHGPPGCGKTLLAHAIAGQLNLPLIEVPATELISGVSGESEERIRDVFEQASIYAPSVLFIDEIDAISSNRSLAQKDMERRIVSQLISSLDSLKLSEDGQSVLVIGATTRPDMLDPALRRVGRFDHEVAIGIPTRKDRKDILTIICYGLSVDTKCDYDKIAELTPGYVGADLLALVSRAATIAVKRKCSEQIRAFQLESQRNITIVDLDDDADDNAESAANKQTTTSTAKDAADTVQLDSDKATAETKVTATKQPDVNGAKETEPVVNEAMDVDEEKESTKLPAIASEQPAQTDVIVEKEGNKAEVTADGNANADGSADADGNANADGNNDGDDAVADTSNNGSETSKDKAQSAKVTETDPKAVESAAASTLNIPEPSLLELLNWLDNPPEDISFSSEFCITFDDFLDALKVVQPSAKREGFITVPDVTWDDVGSLQDIREELQLAVLAPVKFPEKLINLGLTAPSGVLLCGPPGCGKTLLAKAIANEAGINFISVKGPELMNMYVGESERAVRACFQRARNSAPCVIFFDEFDSLCPKRSEANEAGSGTRVVNQLLTEMDGVEERKGVYILAATNRPDIIDPAILRPGRLDTILYVGLPQNADRIEILKATTKHGKRPVLADDVDFVELSAQTEGYTGADLAGLIRQAAMLALKESLSHPEVTDLRVCKAHFEQALKLLRPSVSVQDRKMYEKIRLKYAAPRTPAADEKAAI